MAIYLNSEDIKISAPSLVAGDRVLLSGTVYTARDAAHKRLLELIEHGRGLPFDLNGACIYYTGPTSTPPGRAIGSCGPTTSGRMDSLTVTLLEKGLAGMIGKGERSPLVIEAIKKFQAVYFCALGGAGALAAECVTACEEVAFEDLGCESIKRLRFENFPLIVGVDSKGGNIYDRKSRGK